MKTFSDFSLRSYNTFGMDVNCRRFILLEQESDIASLQESDFHDGPFYILGGGSNTLFTKDFDGTIVHPAFKGMQVMDEDSEQVLLRVAAGEDWNDFQQYCIENQWFGLENLVGIPGLVGSSPVQNIGAYGVEVKDCIDHVEGFFLDDFSPFTMRNTECHFAYRNSIFKQELKGKCLIGAVWFKLSKKERYNLSYKALANELAARQCPITLKNVTDSIIHIRNSKLPDITKIGCAGSFFKNPVVPRAQYEALLAATPDLVSYPVDELHVKLAAGQLIEKAGWKGKRIGDAGVYPLQALVLVNYGTAKPNEIVDVCHQVIHDVQQIFGVELSPEVNIIA